MDTYGYKSLVESLDTIKMTPRERAQAMAHARLCADMLSFFRGVASTLGFARREA